MNVTAGSATDLQYFYGKAFTDPRFIYDKNYIVDTLNTQLKKISTSKNTNLKIQVGIVNEYLAKESIIYSKLKISHPTQLNYTETELVNFINEMKRVSKELTQKLTFPEDKNNKSEGTLFDLLKLFNNIDFVHYIAGRTTMLSFTKYGKVTNKDKSKSNAQSRIEGKDELTRIMSKMIYADASKSRKRDLTNALLPFVELLKQDFKEGTVVVERQLAAELTELIRKEADDWAKQLIPDRDKRRNPKFNYYSKKGEKIIKDGYKKIYRLILSQGKFKKLFNETNKYLGGALTLNESFQSQPYSESFMYTVLYDPKTRQRTSVWSDKEEGFKIVVNEFVEFLIKYTGNFTNTDVGASDRKGYLYLKDNGDKIKKAIYDVYSDHDPTSFAQFALPNISGLLGEIGASLALSQGFEPFLNGKQDKNFSITNVGDTKNDLGFKIGSDINVTIQGQSVGFQIKNYTSKVAPTLYEQEYRLNGDSIPYLKAADNRLIRFLLVNYGLINLPENETGIHINGGLNLKEAIEAFLTANYTSEFSRANDLHNDSNVKVSFYWVNNEIIPFTQILAEQLLVFLRNSKYTFSFDEYTFPELITINGDDDIDGYVNAREPKDLDMIKKSVNKNNTGGQSVGPNLVSLKIGKGLFLPKRISNKNLISDIVFKFNGIAIK